MASTQDPNLGLYHSWDLGEHNWNTGMDLNLKKLGALFFLTVISATTTAQPVTPSEGDRYIVPASATGTDWSGEDGKIAVYSEADWLFYVPANRWIAHVQDVDQKMMYNGSTWTSETLGNVVINDYQEKTNTSASNTISRADGGIQSLTVTANTTISMDLIDGQSLTLHLIDGDSYTITWTGVSWVGLTPPTLDAHSVLEFWHFDSTLYGAYIGEVA